MSPEVPSTPISLRFALPCNWDEELIPVARAFDALELYGQLPSDPFGGGRASFMLRHVDRGYVAGYVRRLREAGIDFNYLASGTCMHNLEFTAAGQKRIRRHLDWLSEIGVTRLTVSIPYLLRIVRRCYPHFRVCVSSMAGVSSVQQARFWEDEGADVLILLSGRNFPLLRALREQVGCELEVIANLVCLNQCPLAGYHGVCVSHNSQVGSPHMGLPFCEFSCTVAKFSNPAELIASPWIRPEDLHYYEDLGITRLKIVDRCSPSPLIERIVAAYAKRTSPENLAELLPGLQPVQSSQLPLARKLRYFFRPFSYNLFRAARLRDLPERPRVVIHSRRLEGFLEPFLQRDCRLLSCRECGYCQSVADQVLEIDQEAAERLLGRYGEALDEMASGRFYFYR